MASIEQVSKRLFSDPRWLAKCLIGAVLSIVPIVNFLAFGYLFRLFKAGRAMQPLQLPEWDDWQALFFDGLRFFVAMLLFVILPVGLIASLLSMMGGLQFLMALPLIPVAFFALPAMCAAMYLYLVNGNIKDAFNINALGLMLRGAMASYAVPTLAYLGLLFLMKVVFVFPFFFGGVMYFYLMGQIFRELQQTHG